MWVVETAKYYHLCNSEEHAKEKSLALDKVGIKNKMYNCTIGYLAKGNKKVIS